MEDRRTGTVLEFNKKNGCGTIMEDETGQTIFVNRRAVKRLAEPRWRHSLRAGEERVSFAKVGGLKGFWAAGVMRIKEVTPVEVWEKSADHLHQQASSQVSWAEPATALPAPMVGGSVYVTGEAMVTLVHRAQTPALAQRYACAVSRSLDLTPERGESLAWGAGALPSPCPSPTARSCDHQSIYPQRKWVLCRPRSGCPPAANTLCHPGGTASSSSADLSGTGTCCSFFEVEFLIC